MRTEQIKRRLHRIEKAVAIALNAVRIRCLVSLPDGNTQQIPLGRLKEYEEQGASFDDVIIHVPDKRGGKGL